MLDHSCRGRAFVCLALFLIILTIAVFFTAVAPDQRTPFYPVFSNGAR